MLDAASIAEIASSHNISHRQRSAYAELERLLRAARRVRAVVIGGSVAAGSWCDDLKHGLRGTKCAFTSRFGDWMRCHYAHRQLDVANRARGGVTTAAALPLLPSMVRVYDDMNKEAIADWLLIDFSANDAAFGYYYGGDSELAPSKRPVAAATEVMLRYLTSEYPKLALLVIESSCKPAYSSRAHEWVARHYGVPYLPYAQALKRDVGCSAQAWHTSHGHVHPLWDTHVNLAEMLAEWWRAFSASLPTSEDERERAAPPTKVDEHEELPYLTSASARAVFAICRSAVTVYDAHEAYAARGASPHGVTSRGWTLYEDRPSKPGWITSGPQGASIQFNLAFGKTPRLLLLYEAGYEGWGSVHLNLGKPGPRAAKYLKVRALRTGGENVTQAELLALEVGADSEGGRNNHNISSFANATLELVFVSQPPLKFKVLHVSSC